MTDPSRLVREVAQLLLDDARLAALDWAALSIVMRPDDGGPASILGYAYADDGEFTATVPDDPQVFDAGRRLREAMAAQNPTGRAWGAMLVQLRRSDLKLRVEFEYDDAARWDVTPANWDSRPQELRPLFD